eukprot:CAMPEP_0195523006 /NCGR_PEP_ID=MMETSP0794_2-20130614/21736_1 /TAXON_ID=515487 /ORGANISM="Stephanopyxis turris, Strain CCMP 815" /LENGTH=344 /DNA_ID=CAMNT_0040652903 /DNA_START=121 /DNA_END=1155 /DNA_ORIENTATION=-
MIIQHPPQTILLRALLLSTILTTTLTNSLCLKPGNRVLLVGPGFLQLNIAKACKAAGLKPVIVAPQQKIERFATLVNDPEIIRDASIGVPDDEKYLHGVVFCSEEAVFGPDIISTVLDWSAHECYDTPDNKPLRVVACVPLSNSLTKTKSMGWMPVLNNDGREKKVWEAFTDAWKKHPIASSDAGTLVRFGSLLGGSIDGPDELRDLGLDEGIYKMSLENYRDLKERSFDRYRTGVQILQGDSVNAKPKEQDGLERNSKMNGEEVEAFRITGGYPEQDRANRHSVAQAVVQTLLRPNRGDYEMEGNGVPREFTVLSKSTSSLPTEKEWDEMFRNPGPAPWPVPE